MRKPDPKALSTVLDTIDSLTPTFTESLQARKDLRRAAGTNRRRYTTRLLAAAAICSGEATYEQTDKNALLRPYQTPPPSLPKTRDPITRCLRALEKLETLLPPFTNDTSARTALRQKIGNNNLAIRRHLLWLTDCLATEQRYQEHLPTNTTHQELLDDTKRWTKTTPRRCQT